MSSVKLVLRIQQKDATEHCPLYIRIIKDRKARFVSTGIRLKETEWDDEKQRVKKNHSNSNRLNAALMQKIADAEGQIADIERNKSNISAKKIKEIIKGKKAIQFFGYAYDKCEKMRGSVSYRTYESYVSYVKKFETFNNGKEIHFEDISVSLLNDYVNYMTKNLNNGATTQNFSLKVLAIIFKQAHKEDIIPESVYPFNKVKIKKTLGKRLFLNKQQLESLQNLALEEDCTAAIVRDMFLFSVYAGGLRFSDVVTLQKKHYFEEEARIKKVIRKTNRLHQFKIGNLAKSIIDKYTKNIKKLDDCIFPLIEGNVFEQLSESTQVKLIRHGNQIARWHLLNFGKKIDLPFPLTFHLSRHTFATNALNNGMRIEYVSKLMDHTNIVTTQIYAKIINEELDKAVDLYIN